MTVVSGSRLWLGTKRTPFITGVLIFVSLTFVGWLLLSVPLTLRRFWGAFGGLKADAPSIQAEVLLAVSVQGWVRGITFLSITSASSPDLQGRRGVSDASTQLILSLWIMSKWASKPLGPQITQSPMNRDTSLGNWLSFPASTPHRIAYFPRVKLNMLLFILIFPFSWEPGRDGLVPRALSTREPHGSFYGICILLHQLTFLSCMWSLEFFFSELSVVLTSWLGFFI